MEPLVSICIPTHNGEKFIKSTLESAAHQTYKNVEIIVSDDGSSDRTVEIVRQMNLSNLTFIDKRDAQIVADNWNSSIEGASGEFIKLLCQDDILYPDAIETEVNLLMEHPSASFCWSKRDIISPKGRVLLPKRGQGLNKTEISFDDGIADVISLGTNIFGEPCAVLVRADRIKQTNGFQGDYEIDLNMWFQLWQLGTAVYSENCLAQFRISQSAWTSTLRGSHSAHVARLFHDISHSRPDLISQKILHKGLKRARRNQIFRNIFLSTANFFHL
jgi:glycosyltransferase involved in cell wall biosynthesis